MYKKYYQFFLSQQKDKLHFASHSHHFWPDVTRDAQIQYWDDSAKYVDDKWEFFFSKKLPKLSESISKFLGFNGSDRWVYAPNTHELVYRILSSLPQQKFRVLTTDSEFHSFRRQIEILEKNDKCEVTYVDAFPSQSFAQRFSNVFLQNSYDVVFLSSCFFNSGLRSDIQFILTQIIDSKALIIVDGYHSFFAYPMDFVSRYQDRVFFIGGSYKYAQGGEGLCFAWVPKWFNQQGFLPKNSGWFAEIEKIDSAKNNQVFYSPGASVLSGSTMDFSGAYRLQAVLDLFVQEGLSIKVIDQNIQKLMACLLAHLDLKSKSQNIDQGQNQGLVESEEGLCQRGHFLSFQFKDEETVGLIKQSMKSKGLLVDSRGNKLRFGFGMYHDLKDAETAAEIFNLVLKDLNLEIV